MNQPPATPWIHIGECPVCVDGLCRVRTCDPSSGARHFYAICDECEATWTRPDVDSKKTFPDAQDPRCPICAAKLYGEQSHWSVAEELADSEWAENAIFEISTDVITDGGVGDWLTTDDLIHDIDAPPNDPAAGKASELNGGQTEQPQLEGEAYGQDDPKPGC